MSDASIGATYGPGFTAPDACGCVYQPCECPKFQPEPVEGAFVIEHLKAIRITGL